MQPQVRFVARGPRRWRRGLLTSAVAVLVAASVTASVRGGGPAPEHQVADAAPATVPSSPTPTRPTPSPTPPPQPPVPATRAAVVAQLEGLLASPGVSGTLAVQVLDEHGRVVIDRGGSTPLLPASTQKLVTAAAALHALGPDHTFRTRLHTTATPTGSVLAGDLVLVGGGDPALASPLYGEMVYPARPRTPLEYLADAVVAAGITHVEGSVVGDARAYPTVPEADGWFPRYFHDLDARYVSSLTAEAGLRVTYDEPADDLTIELSSDPVTEAAAVLHGLLLERGVTVVGAPRAADTTALATQELAHVDSPPLAELLRHTVQRSDNHMADTILHAVALEVTGQAGWAAGARGVHGALVDLDLDWRGVHLADGSGLSRSNLLTAGFLTSLEQRMYADEHRDVWRELMAVAGHEGTLRHRLRHTPAELVFTGKTGTLDDVRAVTGTVHGEDGRAYHVTVVGNEQTDPTSRANLRTLMDNIALILASDLRGCTETSTPYDPAIHPAPPPRTWDCPAA